MKATLKVQQHEVLPSQIAVEVWWEGKLIGCVYGGDWPGIRFVSKFPITAGTFQSEPLLLLHQRGHREPSRPNQGTERQGVMSERYDKAFKNQVLVAYYKLPTAASGRVVRGALQGLAGFFGITPTLITEWAKEEKARKSPVRLNRTMRRR